MSDITLSKLTGLNTNCIYDLETYEDELENYELPVVLRLCAALSINIVDIYKQLTTDIEHLTLSEIVKKRRLDKHLSVNELSDSIGYDATVVDAIENDGDLTGICLDAFKIMACELDLPLVLLLEKLACVKSKYIIPEEQLGI